VNAELRAFINGLRRRAAVPDEATPLPSQAVTALRAVAGSDDCAALFAARAAEAGCRVHRCQADALGECVRDVLRAGGISNVVLQS
jgi:hypothetical protein